MLEGVGVLAYWLKHWPLSNQKISKEIATKSSPSIGWVGNFGVIGHFTSAGSIPTGARFSTASCPQWMPQTIFGQAPRRILAAQFRFFSRVLRRHAPEDISHLPWCLHVFLPFFGDWDSGSRSFESEQPHEIQWFDHVERWHMPCPYRSVFGRLSNSCNLATIF